MIEAEKCETEKCKVSIMGNMPTILQEFMFICESMKKALGEDVAEEAFEFSTGIKEKNKEEITRKLSKMCEEYRKRVELL